MIQIKNFIFFHHDYLHSGTSFSWSCWYHWHHRGHTSVLVHDKKLKEDIVICFKSVQILMEGKEETPIVPFLVSNGVNKSEVWWIPGLVIEVFTSTPLTVPWGKFYIKIWTSAMLLSLFHQQLSLKIFFPHNHTSALTKSIHATATAGEASLSLPKEEEGKQFSRKKNCSFKNRMTFRTIRPLRLPREKVGCQVLW